MRCFSPRLRPQTGKNYNIKHNAIPASPCHRALGSGGSNHPEGCAGCKSAAGPRPGAREHRPRAAEARARVWGKVRHRPYAILKARVVGAGLHPSDAIPVGTDLPEPGAKEIGHFVSSREYFGSSEPAARCRCRAGATTCHLHSEHEGWVPRYN